MSTREIIYAAAGASGPATYIEDVFSTWLYTGTGASQTITNGIDLAGKGGMVWTKGRSTARDNNIVDTVRGGDNMLYTNQTIAQFSLSGLGFSSFSFGSSGYTASNAPVDAENGATFVSWTFRKQPKFFDVVTYTGDGSSNRQIAHNLGSVPGMMIVKQTSASGQRWNVYHRAASATPQNGRLALNTTDQYFEYPAIPSFDTLWNLTQPTDTVFTVGSNDDVNQSGQTYVAYLFAHNAGGFGLTGTDNVISCGSYTGNGSNAGPTITLGYEPQYVLIKSATSAQGWWIFDSMRGGLSLVGYTALTANTSNAEVASSSVQLVGANATGFQLTNSTPVTNASGQTYIYMAIRRGPMKTPTSGTSVFSPNVETTTTTPQTVTTGFPVDLCINTLRNGGFGSTPVMDRLRGGTINSYNFLNTSSTAAESTGNTPALGFDNNTGLVDNGWLTNTSAILWNFRRAPGFFDEVCYTGTGSARTVTHNLGAVPELMIVKRRNTSGTSWFTYSAATGNTNALLLDTTDAAFNVGATGWNSTTPTSSVFSLGTSVGVNQSASTYVTYLFASVAGVSKVGSYTGTGSTLSINAGLPTGARFVLIKRTDDVGDWWVWDTARGMVTSTDPRLALNLTTAELNNNWVYNVTNGFQIVTTDASVNANGGSYIYLAIA